MRIAARTSVTAARVSGLTNGVPYDIRVRACGAAGVCGDWSTPAGGRRTPRYVSSSKPSVHTADCFNCGKVTAS